MSSTTYHVRKALKIALQDHKNKHIIVLAQEDGWRVLGIWAHLMGNKP